MTYNYIQVTPLATHIGAQILGVDLAGPPGRRELAEIRRAFGTYGVVLSRPAADAGAADGVRALFWRDRRQPLLRDGAGLPDDRRGAQGAGAAAQYRQRLA